MLTLLQGSPRILDTVSKRGGVDMQRAQRDSTVICQICKKQKKPSDVIAGELAKKKAYLGW
jgi:hypothetical protein